MTIIELLHADGRLMVSAGFDESLPDVWSWILDTLVRECACDEADVTCVERDETDPRDRIAVRGVVVAECISRPAGREC